MVPVKQNQQKMLLRMLKKMMTKTWTLTINQQLLTLTLAPPNQRGTCFKCSLNKEITVISEKPVWIGSTPTWEEKKFCWSCSLANLYELEESNYEIKNKKEVISEIRETLNNQPAIDSNYQADCHD